MITEIEPYLVNKRFNSELFDGLDGYYTNSFQFYPLDEIYDATEPILHQDIEKFIILRILRAKYTQNFN